MIIKTNIPNYDLLQRKEKYLIFIRIEFLIKNGHFFKRPYIIITKRQINSDFLKNYLAFTQKRTIFSIICNYITLSKIYILHFITRKYSSQKLTSNITSSIAQCINSKIPII